MIKTLESGASPYCSMEPNETHDILTHARGEHHENHWHYNMAQLPRSHLDKLDAVHLNGHDVASKHD